MADRRPRRTAEDVARLKAEAAPPAPPHPAPAGHRWQADPDQGWRLVSGKRCRAGAGGGPRRSRRACGQPAVAEVNRSTSLHGSNWWAYCGDHLYGGWVEDGPAGRCVMRWVLVDDPAGGERDG